MSDKFEWTEEDEKEIRDDAYFKWVDAGRPPGKDQFFWNQAAREKYARTVAPNSKIASSTILKCPDCDQCLWSGEWLDYCSCGWIEPIEVIEVRFPYKKKPNSLWEWMSFGTLSGDYSTITPNTIWQS